MGEHGDNLEENLGALFKPSHSDWEKFKATIELAAALGEELPGLGVAIKAVAWQRAWFGDRKKVDRVQPVILGMVERIQKLEGEARDYVRREEAQALVEEALRRLGDQPDEARREEVRKVFYKILGQPRDHADNRLFIRLADEMPVQARKLLAALHAPAGQNEAIVSNEMILAHRSGLDEREVKMWWRYLVNESLVDDDQLHSRQHGTFEKMLTDLGRLFEHYRRG